MSNFVYIIAAAPFLLSFFTGEYGYLVAFTYFSMSAVSILFYYLDKKRAVEDCFRISEIRLHMIELLFGWPGAIIAQKKFRHKCLKKGYQIKFWLIVSLHFIGWVFVLFYDNIMNLMD